MISLSPLHPSHIKTSFIDHALFHETNAKEQIAALLPVPEPPASQAHRYGRSVALSQLCQRPPLSKDLEHDLFCRMNFEKFQAARMEDVVRPAHRDDEWYREHSEHLEKADDIRNVIVESNLRLAVAMAQPFAETEETLEELVADATLPLIRAVELFDVSRGLCFSTYAGHTLRNHYLRYGKRRSRLARRQVQADSQQFDTVPEDRPLASEQERRVASHRQLAKQMLTTLSDREQCILKSRFGLSAPEPQTFTEVGETVGLSKERVRVLTHRALDRLRELRVEEPEFVG